MRGLLITHGHEDHVGGIPYLLKEINMPVYGTKLTLALADNKLREHRLNKVQMNTVKPGDKVKLGCFTVEFINVNHSIAGSVALCIDTPNGKIFHTSRANRSIFRVSRRSAGKGSNFCCASRPTSSAPATP